MSENVETSNNGHTEFKIQVPVVQTQAATPALNSGLSPPTSCGFLQDTVYVWLTLACVFFLAFLMAVSWCIYLLCKFRHQQQSKEPDVVKWPARTAGSNVQLLADGEKAEGGQAGEIKSKAGVGKSAPQKIAGQTEKKDSKKVKDEGKGGEAAKTAGIKEKDKFQIPKGDKIVDKKDPNYQSLKGIPNDIFEKKGEANNNDQKEKMKKNEYETLENVDKEEKAIKESEGGAEEEEKEAKRPKFRPPDKVEKVASKNPQYETLAGIDDQLFKKKEEAAAAAAVAASQRKSDKEREKSCDEEDDKPKKVFKRPEMVKVSAKNPQYETFADVADDIFKGKK